MQRGKTLVELQRELDTIQDKLTQKKTAVDTSISPGGGFVPGFLVKRSIDTLHAKKRTLEDAIESHPDTLAARTNQNKF
jgi:hypothetical protein